ncbi:MAG: DivIVA domain-containing protein [Propionibacteriaceae bacterium]|jgi:DivIVA domain-containing protein|nr:DivIVA domain-containing protein [Propionibacteriaceae bacterium]
MEWFITLIAVAVIGLAVVAATGRLGQFGGWRLRPSTKLRLTASPLLAEDIAQLRFDVVPQGYAMDQVDEVLERIENQLRNNRSESGIMENGQLSEKRNHDGSDETSHG